MNKEQIIKYYLLFFLILSANFTFGQVETIYIKPIQIDSSYSPAEDSMAISTNSSVQLNKLFLFIGGTNSSSSRTYNALRLYSASLGFDFINVGYPNNVAAASLANSDDSLAFDNYREEICFGTPVSNAVSVDSINSIYTRTLKLIRYLEVTYPSQNWGEYLTATNSINWSKIVIGGHSQGAGHASYLGKQFLMNRVLMFSGPNDFSDFFLNSAHWLRQSGSTPTIRHFAYLSLNDEIVDFTKQYVNLSGLGMLTNDDTTYVDNKLPPYENSNFLYTTQSPGIVILNHSVPVKFSSINTDVWTYMLTSSITTGVSNTTKYIDISIYPNPTTSVLYLKSKQNLRGKLFTLSNHLGQRIRTERITGENHNIIDVSGMVRGFYYLTIDGSTTKIIKE